MFEYSTHAINRNQVPAPVFYCELRTRKSCAQSAITRRSRKNKEKWSVRGQTRDISPVTDDDDTDAFGDIPAKEQMLRPRGGGCYFKRECVHVSVSISSPSCDHLAVNLPTL